ncbi:LLM class flavin-dependent oxidoreductase [soil metagenome]
MKFDIWYDCRNPARWHREPSELYAETLDQISWADDLGFTCAWVSEHHFTDEGYLPAVMPMLAAMAMRTRRLRLGTAVLLAPLHHPLRLAEEAAVVDILSGGRLELGIAPGYRVSEFDVMGIDKRERGGRTNETIELLIQAWTRDRVDFSGEHFTFSDVPVTPHPVQTPHPPIWVGGSTPAAARRAGRYGCRFMPDSGAPAEVYSIYRDELERNGHPPPTEIATNMVVYVCDDPERGWSEVKDHYFYVYQTYQRWFAEAGDLTQVGQALTEPDQLSRDTHIVGTPEMVIETIERRRESHPFDRLIFWARPPGLDIDKSSRSLELFATQVLPHFQIFSGEATPLH